jgi:hypothetical protein
MFASKPVAGKPLASLSSGLLARKGTARPAMRPQGFNSADDLGWNDMGGPTPPPAPEPAPVPAVLLERAMLLEASVLPENTVLREEIEAPAAASTPEPKPARPVSVATAQRMARDSAKLTKRGKAAFTLRLDSERHLRLRLAVALANRSAQQLVTDALDAFLDDRPEVDALVAHIAAPKA